MWIVYLFIDFKLPGSFSKYSASAQMTTDISTGLSSIEGYADSALAVAVGIGGLVIGWAYIKRLVKKG